MKTICLILFFIVCFSLSAFAAEKMKEKPNVFFIAIDDLRDWTGYLKTHQQVQTPSLDKLASQSVIFDNSYCSLPCCNPSRTSLMTGLRPGTTGVYSNGHDWRKIIKPDVVLLQEHFQNNGYETFGVGKIYHESYRTERGWTEYHFVDPKLYAKSDTERVAAKNNQPLDDDENPYANGVGGIQSRPLEVNDEDMIDYHNVNYGIEQLNKKHDKPFFLAVGFKKPHMPWNVPKKYYDLYPLDGIQLPVVKENDLDDVPPEAINFAKSQGDHAKILKSGRWKNVVQAYLATITFTDGQIGRLLDAFEKSAYKDNTIVVLWSDHGWHLGEKEHWRKFALWEESNRQPLLWKVPGLTKAGTRTTTPVDLTHVYPTLIDLAGLPQPKQQLEGKSIRSILENPGDAEGTAVSTWLYNNHTVRTNEWRYTHKQL